MAPRPEQGWQGLADEYYAKNAWRPPLKIILPNGFPFCVDSRVTGKTSGWDVTGEPPNITLSPSVNYGPGDPNGWHGFIKDGVMTDDLDGRKYD